MFQHEARSRFVPDHTDSNPKGRSLATLRYEKNFDRVPAGRLRLPAYLFFIPMRHDFVVSEGLDCKAAGVCDLGQRRGLGRLKLTLDEDDRVCIKAADQHQGAAARSQGREGDGNGQTLDY